MRAAVLSEIPGKLEIDDVQIDKPGPHEVLIRTAAAGLCHSDLHFMEGKYPCPTAGGARPRVGGRRRGGRRRRSRTCKPGDHVITCLSVFCGHCEHCLTGHLSLCDEQGGDCSAPRGAAAPHRGTAQPMSQFFDLSSLRRADARARARAREDPRGHAARPRRADRLRRHHRASARCSTPRRSSPARRSRSSAAAASGSTASKAPRIAGAAVSSPSTRSTRSSSSPSTFGATDIVDASEGDPVAQVQEITGGGVHYAFEAIGLKATAEQAFAHAAARRHRDGHRHDPARPDRRAPRLRVAHARRELQGSNMGSNRFRVDMPRYIDLYLQGRLKLDELVLARIALDEVNDGFEAMKAGSVARSVIVFDS